MAAASMLNIRDVSGLFGAPTVADLRESSITPGSYNGLPHVEAQPEIPQQHITALLGMLRRYKLGNIFGFHLIHRHDEIGDRMIRVEASLSSKPGTWTKPVLIDDVNPASIHGSLFMLQSDGRLIAYEYREGQLQSSLATTDPTFFRELADYILRHNLASLVALEILDIPDDGDQQMEGWAEYELEGGGTVVLAKSDTYRGVFARATGWTLRWNGGPDDPDPKPQPNTHYEKTTKGTHRVFVKKQDLQSEEGLIAALEAANVLKASSSELT